MRILSIFCVLFLFLSVPDSSAQEAQPRFVHVHGESIVAPDGSPLLLRGINLGNWLVPEGYMFLLDSASSPRLINNLLTELVGPEDAKTFWRTFRDTYISQADIRYIKSLGLNSIRVPFNARLFLPEEYGDLWSQEPYVYLDRVLAWCREEGLRVVFDMHCAPGGQTGDNIDDSWGYPFLFESAAAQERTVEVWKRIAERYANEPILVGYDLLNEPIAHFFDQDRLNPRLEPLYRRIVAGIRSVDKNHLVFLGGAQWDTNFKVFGPPFDDKAVYTFHRYWCDTTQAMVQEFTDFRSKHSVPIWLGESGENTNEWIASFRRLLERNNIGWCFWPYKRMDASRCIVTFGKPGGWEAIQAYDRACRSGYGGIRAGRPPMAVVRNILDEYLRLIQFTSCRPNEGYITALGCSLPGGPVRH